VTEPTVEQLVTPVDLSGVQIYDITDRTHALDDLDYPQTPPAGGAHAPVWLEYGAYEEPVRDENAVHDLEHGTVWITYDPTLPEREVDALVESCRATGSCRRTRACPVPWW
jgi:hypothetical protein